MHVVFMGTPDFAVPSLRALTDEHEVLAVLTRPDAVRGRGRTVTPSAVKEEALALGIPVHEPATLRDPEALRLLSELGPDVIVVAAYGLILPPEVLAIPPRGAVNVHASLLPTWRGAAPVARAILAGDDVTGVSIMRMEEGLDTGPYALTAEVAVDDLYVEDLTARLAEIGADALLGTLRHMEAGSVVWTTQDEAAATYAPKISAEELALGPALAVDDAWRRVRASTDSAPSAAVVAGRRMRLLEARPLDPETAPAPPAGSVRAGREGLVLGLADGGLVLRRVVPQGKQAMDGDAWARGARPGDDARWEAP